MTRARIAALRRLTSASFFFTGSIFNFVNLFLFSLNSGSISVILESLWCFAWFVTAIHQLGYRGIIAVRTFRQNDTPPYIPMHSLVKSSLITSTASAALIMDGYRVANPTTSHIMRTLGSIAWVGIGSMEIALVRKHEFKEANNPRDIIRFYNIRPSVYYALHACLYLSAGICYAVAVWTDEEHAPQDISPELAWIRPIPNLCWLLAGINEVTRTLENAAREHITANAEIRSPNILLKA